MLTMTTHNSPKKSDPTSHLEEDHTKGKHVTPSGISTKNQSIIGVIILVIMVTTTGMVFFGLI